MDAVFIALAAAELALFAGFYALGSAYVRKGMRPAETPVPTGLPPAALIVPCTGDSPAMRAALATLIAQDYPGLLLVFAVSHEGDPAAAVIRGLIGDNPRAVLVTAGFATDSCQKNRNLLAALDWLDASAPEVEILLFCDSTHVAKPDLCARLAAPLAKGEAALASGFHQVVPGEARLPVLTMAWTVLAVHLLQAAPFLSQPWGGAMAVTRNVFEGHGIRDIWARAVVDDFTLGPKLLKSGIRCLPVAEACLDTPLGAYGWAQWRDWWFRQLQYLRFCIPPLWVATALGIAALALPLVMAPLYVLAWLLGIGASGMALAGAGHLAALCGLMAAYRPLVPGRPPLSPFIKAGFAFLGGTAWLYAKTWTTSVMTWRDISYDVAFGGKVKKVMRRDGMK